MSVWLNKIEKAPFSKVFQMTFLFFSYPCNVYFLSSLRPFGSSRLCILSLVGSCTHLTGSSRDTKHSVVYNAERVVIGCCLHFMHTSSSAAPIRLTLNPPIYNKIPRWGGGQCNWSVSSQWSSHSGVLLS